MRRRGFVSVDGQPEGKRKRLFCFLLFLLGPAAEKRLTEPSVAPWWRDVVPVTFTWSPIDSSDPRSRTNVTETGQFGANKTRKDGILLMTSWLGFVGFSRFFSW